MVLPSALDKNSNVEIVLSSDMESTEPVDLYSESGQAATDDEDYDYHYPNTTEDYTGKGLRGIIAATMFEVNSATDIETEWNSEDEETIRYNWLLSLLSLAYFGNAYYCVNSSFAVDIIPNTDYRVSVDLPYTGTYNLRNYSKVELNFLPAQ